VDRYAISTKRLINSSWIRRFLKFDGSPKGDNSFYTNYLDGSKLYEDYIDQDLIQYIERSYRAKTGSKWRAIGGTSMGGFGALKSL
jgi:S-formylglutathione hydrolase FrmB